MTCVDLEQVNACWVLKKSFNILVYFTHSVFVDINNCTIFLNFCLLLVQLCHYQMKTVNVKENKVNEQSKNVFLLSVGQYRNVPEYT